MLKELKDKKVLRRDNKRLTARSVTALALIWNRDRGYPLSWRERDVLDGGGTPCLGLEYPLPAARTWNRTLDRISDRTRGVSPWKVAGTRHWGSA